MNVSLICACKNRYDALVVSLNSWLRFDQIKEVIIVDWSSDEPLNHLTKLDDRIKIVTVPDQKYFNQPQPLNLAIGLAKEEYILKVDSDYIINPYFNFFEKYQIDTSSFVSGHHSVPSPEFVDPETGNGLIKSDMSAIEWRDYVNSYSHYFKYLTGLLFVSKKNLLSVGAYNETLSKYYAFEDDEICQRLELFGLTHKKIEYDHTLIHIPHSDSKRLENFEGFSGEEKSRVETLIGEDRWQYEYYLSHMHIRKNKELCSQIVNYYVSPKTKWNIQKLDDQNYFVEKIIDDKLEDIPSVYYISLEESQNRRDNLENQFAFYGVKPKAIISKRFSESNDIVTGDYIDQLNDGTKGCVVSHLKAIKDWYETTDEDYGFFCEDDLSLDTVPLWNFTWKEFVESLPSDAECVQLLTIRGEYDTFELRERYWDDWGATAYIITRDYAKKMIDHYIQQDGSYNLTIPDKNIMPLIENILFSGFGKSYTIPLFVEEVKYQSTFVGMDEDVKDGQKRNHYIAYELVMNWWKNKSGEIFSHKTELEELLFNYSLDTENPEHNFNLGVWYEKQGHTAPALSYYLRCAERAEDRDLAYEALIRGSYCYDKQGTRDGSSRSLLFQAQAFYPERPEAHYLLSRFSEKREWWQDCYIVADFALKHCNFDCPSLITDVGYPGQYGLLYLKSVAAWWWGKNTETRLLLQEIKNNHSHEIKPEDFDFLQNRLTELASGYIPESELKYTKGAGQELRFKFNGWEDVDRNYSQSFQDLFVLSALNGKRNGTYLEIGAQEPFYQNNTALLETKFGWEGASIEIREDLCQMFAQQRKNRILCEDATKTDYLSLLNSFNKGTIIDYLQVDCEPSHVTYEILTKIPFEQYKFRLITYEHDHYVDLTNSYREKSREYLKSKGYELLVANVSLNEWSCFEDWWYHPDLIDPNIAEQMKNLSDITDVRHYMIEL